MMNDTISLNFLFNETPMQVAGMHGGTNRSAPPHSTPA